MGSDNLLGVELPKDANGKVIPLDTEIIYTTNGQVFRVCQFRYSVRVNRWVAYGHYEHGRKSWIDSTSCFLLTPPDSFVKIAEDALMDEYDYCEEFDLDYGDDSCPAEYAMHGDLVRRMEAVAARG